MADQQRSDAYREGEVAGRDIDRQAGDCPYYHEAHDFPLRQDWLAGFAEGRQSAAPAEAARDYHPVAENGRISIEMPVYKPE